MNNTRSLVYLWLDNFVRSMFVCMNCLLCCNYGNKFELFSTNNSFLMYQLTNTAALTFVPNFLDRALTFNDGWYFCFVFWFIGKDSSQNLCVLYTHVFYYWFFLVLFYFLRIDFLSIFWLYFLGKIGTHALTVAGDCYQFICAVHFCCLIRISILCVCLTFCCCCFCMLLYAVDVVTLSF